MVAYAVFCRQAGLVYRSALVSDLLRILFLAQVVPERPLLPGLSTTAWPAWPACPRSTKPAGFTYALVVPPELAIDTATQHEHELPMICRPSCKP